ncbi:MAG: cysteine peptidase family C39 domain-containing protein [Candidatus Woykebacteria bacterium]
MKPLNVALIHQERGSVDCGLATVNMVTKYWELPLTFNDIQKHLKVDKLGIYCPQMGSYLIQQGFDVALVHFNPGLFTLNEVGKSEKEIKTHLQNLLKKKRKRGDKKVIRYFLKFLKDGGKMEVKIPTEEDIRGELNNNRPVIAVLTSNFLTASVPRFNFHFNVITGIDD